MIMTVLDFQLWVYFIFYCNYVPGDSTGCGKGRTIAALIAHSLASGATRCIWVSINNDLMHDAQRGVFLIQNIINILYYLFLVCYITQCCILLFAMFTSDVNDVWQGRAVYNI